MWTRKRGKWVAFGLFQILMTVIYCLGRLGGLIDDSELECKSDVKAAIKRKKACAERGETER